MGEKAQTQRGANVRRHSVWWVCARRRRTHFSPLRVLIACAISVVWFQFALPVYDFTFFTAANKMRYKINAFMCVRFVRSLKVAGLHISRRKTTPNLSQLYTRAWNQRLLDGCFLLLYHCRWFRQAAASALLYSCHWFLSLLVSYKTKWWEFSSCDEIEQSRCKLSGAHWKRTQCTAIYGRCSFFIESYSSSFSSTCIGRRREWAHTLTIYRCRPNWLNLLTSCWFY